MSAAVCSGCGRKSLTTRNVDGIRLCDTCAKDRIPDREFGDVMSGGRNTQVLHMANRSSSQVVRLQCSPRTTVSQALEILSNSSCAD